MKRQTAVAGLLLMAWAALAGCERRAGPDADVLGKVRDNDWSAVQTYLEAGGDPNATSSAGQPLLYIAAGPRGGREVAATLIEGGAEIDGTARNGRTPLMNAAGWCDVDILTILLEAGADPRLRDDSNRTARDSVCAGPLDLRAEVLNILDAELEY